MLPLVNNPPEPTVIQAPQPSNVTELQNNEEKKRQPKKKKNLTEETKPNTEINDQPTTNTSEQPTIEKESNIQGGIERMILLFQLDAAQQTILNMEKNLEQEKLTVQQLKQQNEQLTNSLIQKNRYIRE